VAQADRRAGCACAGAAAAAPPPALLHGDLWGGNLLVREGKLAAFIDPACYHGDAEVDLAMLCLFDSPDEAFWEAYGPLDPGWDERRQSTSCSPRSCTCACSARRMGACSTGCCSQPEPEPGLVQASM
jgi:aminoglycoside phosphotransferase (APT) family kinase protein